MKRRCCPNSALYFLLTLTLLLPDKMFAGTGGPSDELETILIIVIIGLLLLGVYYLVELLKYIHRMFRGDLISSEDGETEDLLNDTPLNNSEQHAM